MPKSLFALRFLHLVRLAVVLLSLGLATYAVAVDLNQASLQELQQIKGIGPKTAQRILEERDRAGAFDSLQDLSDRVKGIGPKRLQGLQEAGLHIAPTTASTAMPPKKPVKP